MLTTRAIVVDCMYSVMSVVSKTVDSLCGCTGWFVSYHDGNP